MLFDILLLNYVNLRSSINFCLCSGGIYLSLSISSSLFVSELSLEEIFETLSAILSPVKSLVDSAVFRIALFEAVLSASVADLEILADSMR